MIFDGIRGRWHQERFKNHWSQIRTLLQERDRIEDEGRKGLVLAVNYELVSHATRALEALRKAEERDVDFGGNAGEARQFLTHLIDLPSISRDNLDITPAHEIESAYSSFLRHQRESQFGNVRSADSEKDASKNSRKERNTVHESNREQALTILHERAEKRLQEFSEETAMLLVSRLMAKKREDNLEAKGLYLSDRPMPTAEQIHLMRMIYVAVGQPFDGETWHNLMIGTWLSFNVRHDRGNLKFDYQQAVLGYRTKIAPKLGDSVHHEAAFANMQGRIYSLITGEPYDFHPPGTTS